LINIAADLSQTAAGSRGRDYLADSARLLRQGWLPKFNFPKVYGELIRDPVEFAAGGNHRSAQLTKAIHTDGFPGLRIDGGPTGLKPGVRGPTSQQLSRCIMAEALNQEWFLMLATLHFVPEYSVPNMPSTMEHPGLLAEVDLARKALKDPQLVVMSAEQLVTQAQAEISMVGTGLGSGASRLPVGNYL
jgi:hypothetical protein